jgi:hypothetical protein
VISALLSRLDTCSVRLVSSFQVYAEQQPLWPDSKLLCAVAKSGDPVSTPSHQLYSLDSWLTIRTAVRGTKSCLPTRQSLSLGVWLVQLLNLQPWAMLSSGALPCISRLSLGIKACQAPPSLDASNHEWQHDGHLRLRCPVCRALFNNSLQGNVPQEFGSLKRLRGL